MRTGIYSSFAALLLATFMFTGCNSAEQKTAAASKSDKPKEAAAAPADDIRRISVAEAKAEFESDKAIIVDVRGEASYKAGHIKGAKFIPYNEIANRTAELPKDKLIILYCSCPAEQTSVAAAQALKGKNITTTAALVGGYPAWKAAGYPVEEQK
jgi:rhodanese-related sulfurtransferase